MKTADTGRSPARRATIVALAALGLALAFTGAAETHGSASATAPAGARDLVHPTGDVRQCVFAAIPRGLDAGPAVGQSSAQPLDGRSRLRDGRVYNRPGAAGPAIEVNCV